MSLAPLLTLAQARPERNAFLNRAAPNLRMILRQVKFDPEVCRRYEMHFGMSKWELVAYFETLKLAKLQKAASYIVYNCRESDGVIGSRVFHLKKGTKVYVDRYGQPVLKFSCGNPMSRGPLKMLMADLVVPAPTAPPTDLEPETEDLPIQPEMPQEQMIVDELARPAIPAPETPITPPTPPKPEPPTIVRQGFDGPPAWIVPLLSAAIIINHDDHHTRPPAVPEPSAAAVAIIGVGLYGLRRRRTVAL